MSADSQGSKSAQEQVELASVSSAALWRAMAPATFLALALAMAYGFETFSFHLTLDEEIFGEFSNKGYALTWLQQGRWGMSFLTLLVPSPVVPVVSTLIGVSLTGFAFWTLSRRCFGMGRWQAALFSAVAATLPTLAFMFSFSTIAYGIGIGNILLVGFFVGITSGNWSHRAGGVVALAAAIGIYDSFLVAGAALVLASIWIRPRWAGVGIGALSLVLAYLVSKVVTVAAQLRYQTPRDPYVEGFLDMAGLFADPLGRVQRALSSVVDVIALDQARFGLHSPWLAFLVFSLLVFAIVAAIRHIVQRAGFIPFIALLGLLFLPVGVEAASPHPVLLRSMVYLPIWLLVLSLFAIRGLPPLRGRVRSFVAGGAIAVMVLSVVGHAAISNRLFATTEIAYAQDQNLALVIGQEKERLVGADGSLSAPIYFVGTHAWPQSSLLLSRETLGVSFFAGQGGEVQYRNAAFLRSQGVAVHSATEEEIRGVEEYARDMPSYPDPGWVATKDGVLIVKFSDASGG